MHKSGAINICEGHSISNVQNFLAYLKQTFIPIDSLPYWKLLCILLSNES